MFVPVLSISAGKDIKAPSGNFLNACIAGGTLEYVGYVFLIKNAAASSNASSRLSLAPVIIFVLLKGAPMCFIKEPTSSTVLKKIFVFAISKLGVGLSAFHYPEESFFEI